MNWEAVGAIGQTLGSVVTFVALFYLALQVRHAQRDSKRALSQGRSEAVRDLFAFGSQERIARLGLQANRALGAIGGPMQDALTRRAGMTDEEAFAYNGYEAAWWNYQIQVYLNLDELSPIERAAFEFGIRARYRPASVGRVFYDTMRPVSHPDIVHYIDGLLESPR